MANPPPLEGRWLRHRSEEKDGDYHVLACRAEDRGCFSPSVLINAAVDVVNMTSSGSPVSLRWVVMLESCT